MYSAGSCLFSTCSLRIVLLMFCLLLLSRVEAQNRYKEVSVLLDFKNRSLSYGGSSSYWSTWKMTDPNPCSWVGITCTANFTVQAIDLSGWGIKVGDSEINVQILSSLEDLQELDLSNNNFDPGYYMPLGVSLLTGLTRLDLSRNGFIGTIPESINQCTKLRYLSLEQNFFEGQIPSLPGLVNLQVLSLSNNQLNGTISQQFQESTSLVIVDLSNNMLNGTIPSLPKLACLLDLNLDNNYFTGFENPQSPVSTNLRRLSVSRNLLEGPIPPGLINLLSLEFLNMSSNRLSGEIPSGFVQQLNHKFWLDLSQNQLNGEIPADLLPSIDTGSFSLNMSHNQITGEIPSSVGDSLYFEVLDLSNNQLSGSFVNFAHSIRNVSVLWLHNNLLSGDIVDALSEFSQLKVPTELRLENNLFTGDLTKIMTENWFESLFLLRKVDLSNNNLQMRRTKEYPDPVKTILESLSVSFCNEFRVGGNNFSGVSFPAAYNSSSNAKLEVLDLSNSHLEGYISDDVFNIKWLPALTYLNLSNNEATGSIPGDIFQLENLAVLDLSNNNLYGALPAIAVNSPLYNPSYFAGNQLCGAPLAACLVRSVNWWGIFLVLTSSIMVSVCSCAVAVWRWRVYSKRHQQDADLIRTLLERDSASLMPLRDLKKATDNFATSSQIGVGGFGTVYLGTLNNGTTVAIKRSKREGTERDKQQFLNEVRVLSNVNHRHLVKLLGCCMENKIALLVLEYVPNGTLQEHLQGKKGMERLSWKQRVRMAVQTADALNYLHSAASFPIFHRDVKSSNILLSNDLTAKVSDFGISKLVPEEATHASTVTVQGTMGYLDPEYYATGQLTSKSDVYSFGVVILELISAKPAIDNSRGEEEASLVNFATQPIKDGDLERLLDPVLEETYREPAGRESILKVGRLALKCLDMRGKARPSMNEVWMELQSIFSELDGNLDYTIQIDDLALSYSSPALTLSRFELDSNLDYTIQIDDLVLSYSSPALTLSPVNSSRTTGDSTGYADCTSPAQLHAGNNNIQLTESAHFRVH